MPEGMMPQMPGGGTGAATGQVPMMGSAAQAQAQVRAALELLQRSVQGLPMGSKVWTAVMGAITSVTKSLDNEGAGASAATQQLINQAKEAQSNPQQAAMMARMGGGGGGQPQPQPQPQQ